MENGSSFKFGDFVLDIGEQTLVQNDVNIAITPKVFQLLRFLVENPGRIVEKDELMTAVWAESFVEESNLTYSIRQLRKILGDDFTQPKYIETVPRRGYRFIADVTLRSKALLPTVEPVNAKLPRSTGKRRLIFAAALLPVMILIAGGFYFYRASSASNMADPTTHSTLAIISFRNLKPSDETDYLGFAFADTLSTKLTSMRTFKVFPSSLMSNYRSPQDFLRDHKSDLVVTGTYLKENGKLAVSSQVLDVAKNETLFQDSFELGEAQLSQTAEIIARRLINELRLRPQEILKYADMSEINPQSYGHFLKGIEQYSRFRLAESIQNFELAVEIEPNFPEAWAKLGNSLLVSASTHYGGTEYYKRAETAFRKAIELDSSYILPQLLLTNILVETNRKEEAVEILLKVLEKEPENARAWWELSYAYRFAGRLERSIEAGEKAHQVDPGFYLNASAPNYYLYVGDYQKFKASVSRRTDSSYIKFYQGFAEFHLGDRQAARQLFDEAYQLDSNTMQTQIGKALSYSISGENAKALDLLDKIEKEIAAKGITDGEGIYKVAQVYAILGISHRAIKLFTLSVEKGFTCYPYFLNDPLLNNLRSDKKFTDALAKSRVMYDAFKY